MAEAVEMGAEKDGSKSMEMEFTSVDFPWLKSPQKDKLVNLTSVDGSTWGWVGSCMEKGGDLEEIAAKLDPQETQKANELFLNNARAFLGGERTHLMHSVNRAIGKCNIVSLVGGKLRVYFAETTAPDGRRALVRVATCRKINQVGVLSKICDKARANIR